MILPRTRTRTRTVASLLLLSCVTAPALSQARSPEDASRAASDTSVRIGVPAIRVQHLRPRDQRGLNVFETPKDDTVSFRGFAVQWGAAFTQEFQALDHENAATPVVVGGVNQNQLIGIGKGFNNAGANLYIDAQLGRGIRVALASYLSARHHQETWVKDGYFLIDDSPIANPVLDRIMRDVTLRIGHFEINYGDMHFRRTDNGQAIYNPLVGNLILDAFTTEIGAEAYWRRNGFMVMGGATGGEIRGQVTAADRRAPAWLGKLGYDRQLNEDLRVRLTGSMYAAYRSNSNTLYTGDRAGSPYFMVLENTTATETAQAWSGNIRPGFANAVHAYVANPFVKYRGLELFGNIETATGKATTEAAKRTMRQLAVDGTYRFYGDRLYAAARYNTLNGQLRGIANDITVDRVQIGGGWFVMPTLLTKLEYVSQTYHAFPANDIRNGGKFNGVMITGTVAF